MFLGGRDEPDHDGHTRWRWGGFAGCHMAGATPDQYSSVGLDCSYHDHIGAYDEHAGGAE